MQSDRRSPLYHRFLTARQFNDYFAPAPESYATARGLLERAGFRITQSYANRTLIDATAPVSRAERYFDTEIHRVEQSGAGLRYANVRPIVLPAELRTLVTTVAGLSNIAVVKPFYRFPDAAGRAAQLDVARRLTQMSDQRSAELTTPDVQLHPPSMQTSAVLSDAQNLLGNPGFETGGSWAQCGNVRAGVTKANAHSGRYSEIAGSASGSEINGDAGLCQAVNVPRNGVLSFWVYQGSNEPNTRNAWQWALLMDARGKVADSFYLTVKNSAGWKRLTYDVGALAGRHLFLYFGVHGDGRGGHHTYQLVDDVSLIGSAPGTPVTTPTGSPTTAPTSMPTVLPTSAPSSMPTTFPAGPGLPIAGPVTGPNGGWGPVAIARSYDLPVQHGYNGRGRAAGVVIWGNVLASDLNTYEQHWGISRTGTTYRVAVDGGGTYSGNLDDPTNGSVEAELDVETIESNAPGADIYLYDIPTASDSQIEDAYNRAVNDDVVDVLNSSFGGCENASRSFATATNNIALQGAAVGITFSAASGDSGSNECGSNYNLPGVSAPAADPYFVAVGGTSLVANSGGSYQSEVAWNGGGGGVSNYWLQPAYQQGLSGTLPSGRNEPDISLAADPYHGTALYFNGTWFPVGGTSWASPIFSAYVTEVAQMRGTRAGFINPALYAAFRSGGYTNFRDITLGNNIGYAARTGYDQASGIGSFGSGFALVSALP